MFHVREKQLNALVSLIFHNYPWLIIDELNVDLRRMGTHLNVSRLVNEFGHALLTGLFPVCRNNHVYYFAKPVEEEASNTTGVSFSLLFEEML